MREHELRKKVVDTAIGYLGTREGDIEHKQIIDIYNSYKPSPRGYKMTYSDAWCATFVSAVSITLSITKIMPVECSCGQMIELYKGLGTWIENDLYIAEPGDIIFYDWNDNNEGDCKGYPEHVGIVVESSNKALLVIEGNMGNEVAYRRIDVGGKYIRGYGVPAYRNEIQNESENGQNNKKVYIVKENDCLSKIANMYNVSCEQLAVCNNIDDYNKIYIGQKIVIPHLEIMNEYIVQAGDTLAKISKRLGVDIETIVKNNEIRDINLIYVGQKLVI